MKTHVNGNSIDLTNSDAILKIITDMNNKEWSRWYQFNFVAGNKIICVCSMDNYI